MLVCASLGCREERIAIIPTHIRATADANSAKVKDIALGERVRVRRAQSDPPGVLRADVGFVDESVVKKPPFEIALRFVADHGVAIWADTSRTKRKGALKVGDVVTVLAADPFEDVEVMLVDDIDVLVRAVTGDDPKEQGLLPHGYVSRDVLQIDEPTRETAWRRVQAKLRAQDLEATRSALEAMLQIAPGDPVAREMLSVLYAPIDWQKSRSLIAGIAPPPPYVDAGLTRADALGAAYVLASVLRVRAEPNEKAPKVRELPIGTAVVIEELRADGWARVHVRDDRARAVVVDPMRGAGEPLEVPTDVRAKFASGYALAKYLTPTAPTLDVLEARRKDAEGREMFDEAMLWAQRANELAPSRERRAELIDAALQASRFTVAAGALLPSGVERPSAAVRGVANVNNHAALIDVGLAFAWGCRGDPRKAIVVDAESTVTLDGYEHSVNDVPGEDVCISLNVTRPCDLCWNSGEAATPDQIAADQRAMKKAQTFVAKAQAAHDALLQQARQKFPTGPWLRVRTRPSTWPRATGDDGARVSPFLAVVRFDASQIAPLDDELVSVEPLPLPPALAGDESAGVIDVWLRVPADESLRFDIVFANDGDSAMAATPEGVNRGHVAASWARAADGCDCGC